MTPARFQAVTSQYAKLRIAVVGDFCLDRYLEIDPARAETSIETGLPVHNVVRVRAQPGGAGTVLNNLVALGIGAIEVVGFRGDDGEGYEALERGLEASTGVSTEHFLTTPLPSHLHLLQAPGRRARQAPRRAEPARFEELDADPAGDRIPIDRESEGCRPPGRTP